MARFFAQEMEAGIARLSPEETHHAAKVLRLKDGDSCELIWEGKLYAGSLTDAENGVVSVSEELPSTEPTVRVTLYQGIPKGDKMDMICQKCTEAGIFRIVPVEMSRCVAKIDGKDAEKKRVRWQRIAAEAAKQSGRAEVPRIDQPVSLKQLRALTERHALCLIPWEDARGTGIRQAWHGEEDVAVIIGPEGGMTGEEVLLTGAVPVTLGPRIFRTETAGLAALIALMTLSGNLE